MPAYVHDDRPLSLTTPLGEDVLLLKRLKAHEAISELFGFELDLLAEKETRIPFDAILGQPVTIEMRLRDGGKRYFNGIVKRFYQGGRDETFLRYRAEVVPKLWLLTKKVRSRIFQHLTVPDILQQVLAGLNVSYEFSATYYQRDYCVQYRESDFAFASRIMEEEGIFYFFKHSDGSHEMVVTNVTSKHPTVPGPASAIYEELIGEEREDMRVTAWEKCQELRSGECTLWDHCFELPSRNLEAKEKTIASVTVGKVTHKLSVATNADLELYDFPGCYAQRFDGVDHVGGDRPQDIQHISDDRTRTIRIRMEQEEALSLSIEGSSDCGHFTAGHEFTLDRHFDANGKYLLTQIEHNADQADFRTAQSEGFNYSNRFTCIPSGLRYRPQRLTPKPVIAGTQTATVVGPPGEEIFVDKYGRIKVQFHWDREGKKNADSSCWLRVAQIWAGNHWGAFFWPRIGHEVVVAFEEGDPDQPMVVGSVYNAANMPPLGLPGRKMFCGIKSESLRGRAGENYNSLIFVDKKGEEHLAIHSERHMVLHAEYDIASRVGRHQSHRISGVQFSTIGSLPGTGGSGGDTANSGLDAGVGKQSGAAWAQPSPAAVLGMSATTTYGSAFTGSFPLSFQLAMGGLSKLIVDPEGFFTAFPGTLTAPAWVAALSHGSLGSEQVTLGTAATVTFGQSYNIVVGPPPIALDTLDKTGFVPVAKVCAVIMGAAALVYLLAYSLASEGDQGSYDEMRLILLGVFQLLSYACQVVILSTAATHVNTAEKARIAALEIVWQMQPIIVPEAAPWGAALKGDLLTGAVTLALAIGAGTLGGETLETDDSKASSSSSSSGSGKSGSGSSGSGSSGSGSSGSGSSGSGSSGSGSSGSGSGTGSK